MAGPLRYKCHAAAALAAAIAIQMELFMELKLFSGSTHPQLAKAIAAELGIPLGAVELGHFPGGETFVKCTEQIRDADVFIVQPTCCPPNESIMELLIMLDAARRASCGRITAVLPYFGYGRQDRKDQPRVPITAKLIANLLVSAGANRVLTMDLHAQQIQGFFDIPVDHLYAAPVFVAHLRQRFTCDAQVVAPDAGSGKMAHAYADMFGCGFALVAKRRVSASEVEAPYLVGDVDGCDCLLVDDLSSTAGTLVQAALRLREAGARSVSAAVTHCCLTPVGIERINASILEKVYTTDTVPVDVSACPRIEVISVAPLFATAIKRIHQGDSISSLFSLESGK